MLCPLVRKFQSFEETTSTLNIADADVSETLILQGIISHKTATADENG
jgi:hypothetical protein